MSAKILIVEDDFYYAQNLSIMLGNMGFRVVGQAETGQDALRMAVERRPDIILMDIGLTGAMDGIDAAEQVQAREDIPIVFLTAHASFDILSRLENLRAYGYLLKPSKDWQIRTTIELALNSFELEQKLRRSLEYQQALANCSTVLLQPANSDQDRERILNAACGYLMEGARATRVSILKNRVDSVTGPGARLVCDVCRPGIDTSVKLETAIFPALLSSQACCRALEKGQDCGGLVRDLFPNLIAETDLLTAHFFPLHHWQGWWGTLVFADCQRERVWEEEEIPLLRTAAEMLGHAIFRWQTESDLQAARDHLETRVQRRTAALNQTNLALQMLSECNWAISQVQNEDDLLKDVCRIAVETGGYRMAWIGYTQQDDARSVRPLAAAGYEEGYLEDVKITWADIPRGRTPTANAIRSGKPQVIRDIERASEFSIRRREALRRGYRSSIALPLFLRGRVMGALNIYAQSVDAFGSQEIELLTDLAENLSFGIQSIRDRLGREKTEIENRQLLASLDRRLAARTQELVTLFELATLTGGEQDLIDRLSPVISRVMETGYCQSVGLFLLDESRGNLKLFLQREMTAEAVAEMTSIAVSDALKTWLNTENAPIVGKDLSRYPFLPDQLKQQEFNSLIVCQINRQNQPQGLIVFYRTFQNDFSLDEISFLVAITEQINVIIENHHMKQHITDVAVTSERQRLSRDLHDSVAQSLYGLTLLSRSGREAADEGDLDQLQETLTNLESSAFQALKEMRLLLFELRPMALQEEGLVKALNLRLETVERRAGVETVCEMDENLHFAFEIQSDLYMIATEALNNILKHALANRVMVRLGVQNGDLELAIEDNGCGFDPDRLVYGFGLKNMIERAEKLGARFSMDSAPGQGTRICVQIGMDEM